MAHANESLNPLRNPLIDIEIEQEVGELPTFYSVYVLGEDIDVGVG